MTRLPFLFLLLFLGSFLFSSDPDKRGFSPSDAVRAEWNRSVPPLTPQERALLTPQERARLDLSLQRIGAPGTPSLLPRELEEPTLEVWEALALKARLPQERFTALHFLTRLGSKRALSALAGLTPKDALSWPRFLHLEALITTARLRGESLSPELSLFLEALEKAGKVDPVRKAAAERRLFLSGVTAEEPPLLEPTPHAVMALLESWNRIPWERRGEAHLRLLEALSSNDGERLAGAPWKTLGLKGLPLDGDGRFSLRSTLLVRLWEGLPDPSPVVSLTAPSLSGAGFSREEERFLLLAKLGALLRFPLCGESLAELSALRKERLLQEPLFQAALLPVLRRFDSPAADSLRETMLKGENFLARAAAIDDLPAPPSDLDALEKRVWNERELDSAQALFALYERSTLPSAERVRRLSKWLLHPNWSRRYGAYQALLKLDPQTPWPKAPPPTPREKTILDTAERLAESGKPLRLRMDLLSGASLVLRLDGRLAPINTANLLLLAKEGFFDGRRIPRVVPDFVVQMGSPLDTMDGGPGYTVRCENSLTWYAPGSIGMALSGKDTGGSQFFITTNATPHLTGRYTWLGEVEDPERALPLLDNLSLHERILRVVPMD